jgi:hypothetical protein
MNNRSTTNFRQLNRLTGYGLGLFFSFFFRKIPNVRKKNQHFLQICLKVSEMHPSLLTLGHSSQLAPKKQKNKN